MSSSTDTLDRRHPIAVAAARADEQLDVVVDAAARVHELELRVAVQAATRAVGEETGARSTATWWAHQSRMSQPEAIRTMALARALGAGHEPVRAALGAGDLLPDQARAVVESVDALPDGVEPAVVAEAERFCSPRRRPTTPPPCAASAGDCSRWSTLPPPTATSRRSSGSSPSRPPRPPCSRRALLAFAAPKHRASVDGRAPVPGRPSRQRLGQALCELIETCTADRLPRPAEPTRPSW
ncbi:DUF222 domain-containing protein [uncultured Nocardioides sp.]|uniref:DUF222 domain-containing protein n=1 Tax=uncultured Nocardioides sp. TaxID=198441 RepID=UPI0025E035B2|nr:DUF222 domain-containing protein [uncultured Nocardioides sp.]